MPRYIRYIERGEWKYASVKPLGDIEQLKTTSKESVVDAINELIDVGIVTAVENSTVGQEINNLQETVESQAVTIQSQTELTQAIEQAQASFAEKQATIEAEQARVASDLTQAKNDLLEKADVTYVDGELVKKIDTTAHETAYNEIKDDLLEKVDLTKHQTDYGNLVADIGKKVDSIEYQTTIDAINDDIDAQAIEVSTAKTSIATLNTTVADVESRIASAETDVNNIQTDLSTTKSDLVTTQGDLATTSQSLVSAKEDLLATTGKVNNLGDTVVPALDTRITTAEGQIALKAEKTEIDTLEGRVSQSEATLIVQADEIASKVGKLEYDGLAGTVTNQQSSIEQLSDSIAQKVSHEEYDEVTQQVATQETKILQTASDVTILADKSTELDGRVETAEASIVTQAGQIALKAEKSELDTLSGDVSEAKAQLDVQAGQIALKAEQSSVYTKLEADGKLGEKVDTSTYNTKMSAIDVTTNGITQRVTDTEGDINTLTGEVSTVKSDVSTLEQTASQIQSTVSGIETDVDGISGRLATAETQVTQNKTAIELRATKDDVDALSGRVSTAESELTVQAGEIALKASQESVDTELGKKVNTSTYNTKMSSIDLSINGINQTVSSQQTKIDGIDGAVQSHTSQISTIDQKADGIALRVSETEGDITGLTGRVSTAESGITANTTAINLKASQSSVNTLTGRVSDAEGEIEVQAGQISQRVTKTEYDANVGLNKWIVSRYNVNLGSSAGVPSFSHIRGKSPDEVVEFLDAKAMQPFTGEYYIAHFFTNVYVETATTVALSITNDDMSVLYMNGAEISINRGYTTPTNASLSLRKGWNTIEILFYEHAGGEFIDLGIKLSDSVDKLTAHIGIGDKNDTRLSQAETSIVQTEESIALKANKTDVTSLGNRVSETEGSITVLNNSIVSKVEKTEFDAYSQRVSNAESSITQLDNEITQKVSQTDYNLLNNSVKEQETQIQQLNESIALKVDETIVDGLDQRVSSAETEISLTKDEILLKANKTELDEVTGRLTDAEASIEIQSDQITQKVSKTEADSYIGGVKKVRYIRDYLNGSSANTGNHWVEIQAMVDGTNVAQGKSVTSSDGTTTDMARVTDGVHTNTNSWTSTGTGLKYVQIDLGSIREDIEYIGVWHYYGDGRTYRNTKTEVSEDGVNWRAVFDSAVTGEYKETSKGNMIPINSASGLSGLDGRMKSAETSITQTASDITLKANKSDVYTKGQVDGQIGGLQTQITSQGTQITQNASAINLKASKTDVYTKGETDTRVGSKADKTALDAVVNRVSATESSLNVQAGEIALKVSQTDFENLSIGGRNLLRGSSDILKAITIGEWNTIIDEGKHNTLAYYGLVTGDVATYRSYIKVLGDHSATVRASLYRADNTYTSVVGKYVSAGSEGYSQVTFEIPSDVVGIWFGFQNGYAGKGISIPVEYKQAKVEKGNKATDWSPAPEDVQGQIDSQGQRISSAESSITQQAGQIALKVSQTEVNQGVATAKSYTDGQVSPLATRISSAETSITANTSAINLKASKSDVYTKGETDTKVGSKADKSALSAIETRVSSAESSLSVQAGQIASKVEENSFTTFKKETGVHADWMLAENKYITTSGWYRIAVNSGDRAFAKFTIKDTHSGKHSTAIFNSGIHYGNNPTLTLTGYSSYGSQAFTKARIVKQSTYDPVYLELYVVATANLSVWCADNVQSSGWRPLEYTEGGIPAGYTAVEFPIGSQYIADATSQNTAKDTASVNGVPASTITSDISSAKSSITQLAGQITSKVESSTFNTLANRVSSAESTITQQAGSIALRVEKNKVVSEINQSSESIKISANKINITGAVTFSDFANNEKELLAGGSGIVNYNPYFANWTGALPYRVNTWTGVTPTKYNGSTMNGGNGLRFTCTSAQDGGVNLSSFYKTLPNNEYYTVEIDFILLSGTSLSGAGLLLDWSGLSSYRQQINLKDEIDSPVANKWYTVRKVLKRANTTGTYSSMGGYLMANWTGAGERTAKDIVYDRVEVRVSTQQEIDIYNGKSSWDSTTSTLSTWKHPSNSTLINGGKIYTNSVTANQVNVSTLSALSANIGKVTAGTIEGVSFSSMPINKADYLGRTWTEKTDIAVGAVGFRNSATINTSQNSGKYAVQETTLNHDGLMVYARNDNDGVNSFVSVSGTNIQFGGVTSKLSSVGQHFINADGQLSVTSDQKMSFESYKNNIEVNGSLFRANGVMESNLTHTNGYFTVKSFSTSSYGTGQAEIWFNANDNRLTVSSRIGTGGTIGTKINVQDLEVDNLVPRNNGTIEIAGNGEVLRLTSSTGSLSTYAVYARGTDNLLIRSESEIRAFKRTSTGYIPVRASSFPTGSSIRFKDNLEIFSYEEAKEILDNTQVFKYHLKSNLESRIYDKPKIGLISEMVPKQVRDEDGVDVYSITSTLLRISQAHSKEIDALRAENFALKEQMTFVDAENDRQIQELRNEIQEIRQMLVAV